MLSRNIPGRNGGGVGCYYYRSFHFWHGKRGGGIWYPRYGSSNYMKNVGHYPYFYPRLINKALAIRRQRVAKIFMIKSKFHHWNGLYKQQKGNHNGPESEQSSAKNVSFEELKKNRNENYSEELGDYDIDPITLRRQALPRRGSRPGRGNAFSLFPEEEEGYRWFIKSSSSAPDPPVEPVDSIKTGENSTVPPEEEHSPISGTDVQSMNVEKPHNNNVEIDESMKVCGEKDEHSPLADSKDNGITRTPFVEVDETTKSEPGNVLETGGEEHTPFSGTKNEHLEQQADPISTSESIDPSLKVCGETEEHSPLADSSVVSNGEPQEHSPISGSSYKDQLLSKEEELEKLKRGQTPESNKQRNTATSTTADGFENIVDSQSLNRTDQNLDAQRDLYPNLKGNYKDHSKEFDRLYDFISSDQPTNVRSTTSTKTLSRKKTKSSPYPGLKVSVGDLEVAQMFPEDIRKKYQSTENLKEQDMEKFDSAMKQVHDKFKTSEEEGFRAKNAYEYSWENAYSQKPYSLQAKNFFSPVSDLQAQDVARQEAGKVGKEFAILTPSLKTIYTRTLPFKDSKPPQDLFSTLSTMENPGKYVKAISKLEKNGWSCIGGGGPGELLVFERSYSAVRRYNRLLIKLTTSFIGVVGLAALLMKI